MNAIVAIITCRGEEGTPLSRSPYCSPSLHPLAAMVGFGSDSASDELNWLDSLPQHAIFSPQTSMQSRQCMVVRNADVIVANGKSLRIASLSDVKHNHNSPSPSSSSSLAPSLSSYKELVSDALDVDIVDIVLNPSGNLLAVVGSHKVVVVVLPRAGAESGKSIGRQIGVKASAVGRYYYHDRIGGRSRIARVKWHPWGHLGSSLLIMSKDGILREFDAAVDVEEPAQTVSLLPSSLKHVDLPRTKAGRSSSKSFGSRSRTPNMRRSRRSSSRVAFDDDEENSEEEHLADETVAASNSGNNSQAVTFSLGIDTRATEEDPGREDGLQAADWSPLTVYTLCANGDLYALCPFMPRNASVPLSYVHSLSSFVSLRSSSNPASAEGNNRDLQTRYVTSLLKQARARREERTPTSFSISRARRSMSATPMSVDPRASLQPDEEVEEDRTDELVHLQAPASTTVPQQSQPQGPFLLSPAPIELSEDRENVSSDLFFARVGSSKASLDLVGLVGDDGRVDLCLLLEPTEPEWAEGPRKAFARDSRRASSSGRYALSDSEEDDQDEYKETVDARSLPTLYVYETIDLAVYPAALVKQGDVSFSRMGPPHFVLDPIYADTAYVQHATGAHALCFGRWTKDLLAAMALSEEQRPAAMERMLHKGIGSTVVRAVETSGMESGSLNAVVGLSIISDIYLSYSFLALTQSGALIALELGLRVEGEDKSEEQALALDTRSAPPAAYRSLLGDGPPFAPPEPFQSLNGLPYPPRTALKDHHSSGELRVSSESLRMLATVVSTLRGEMREIVHGGNAVQSRLELQLKELYRQLDRIAQASRRIDGCRQRQSTLDDRIKQVLNSQMTLGKRSDRLLQKLVENHSPEVSIYEARWFKELQRLEEDVGSAPSDEGAGLSHRVTKLQYQLDVLRPDLERLRREKRSREVPDGMGARQLQAIEALLTKEAQLLAIDRDKISHLQSRIQRNSVQ